MAINQSGTGRNSPQCSAMDKKDSTGLAERIELLLRIMTSGRAEDDNDSEDSNSLDDADQSEPETEEDEPNYRDIKMNQDEDNFNASLRLSKFREDVEKSRKCLPPTAGDETRDGIRFEGKMYRVIPIKLDEKIPELRKLIDSS